MAHTKGKWFVMGNQRHGHIDFVLPMADDKDFQANCRLIAAAPELLDFVLTWNGHNPDCSYLDEGSPCSDCTCGYEIARNQVIDKAAL